MSTQGTPTKKGGFASMSGKKSTPPAAEREQCIKCNNVFGMMSRKKTKCASCNKIYCSNCASHLIDIPEKGFATPQPACDDCVKILEATPLPDGGVREKAVSIHPAPAPAKPAAAAESPYRPPPAKTAAVTTPAPVATPSTVILSPTNTATPVINNGTPAVVTPATIAAGTPLGSTPFPSTTPAATPQKDNGAGTGAPLGLPSLVAAPLPRMTSTGSAKDLTALANSGGNTGTPNTSVVNSDGSIARPWASLVESAGTSSSTIQPVQLPAVVAPVPLPTPAAPSADAVELAKMKEELAATKRSQFKMNSDNETLMSTNRLLKDQLSMQESELRTSRDQIASLKSQMEALNGRDMHQSNAQLAKKMSEMDQLASDHRTALTAKDNEIASLRAQLVASKSQASAATTSLNSAQEQATSSQAGITDLQKQVADLKKQLADKIKDYEAQLVERDLDLEAAMDVNQATKKLALEAKNHALSMDKLAKERGERVAALEAELSEIKSTADDHRYDLSVNKGALAKKDAEISRLLAALQTSTEASTQKDADLQVVLAREREAYRRSEEALQQVEVFRAELASRTTDIENQAAELAAMRRLIGKLKEQLAAPPHSGIDIRAPLAIIVQAHAYIDSVGPEMFTVQEERATALLRLAREVLPNFDPILKDLDRLTGGDSEFQKTVAAISDVASTTEHLLRLAAAPRKKVLGTKILAMPGNLMVPENLATEKFDQLQHDYSAVLCQCCMHFNRALVRRR